jgi:hypothetical protein
MVGRLEDKWEMWIIAILYSKDMELFTNLHSLFSFYCLIQTAAQHLLLLFSFSLTPSSHAGAPRASDSGPLPRLLCAL